MEINFLLVFAVLSSALALLFGFYAIRFGIILLRVQDQLEESLDILDSQYQNVSDILKMPVYSDNNEVRSVVNSIKSAQDSIVLVANVMTRHSSQKEIVEIEKD